MGLSRFVVWVGGPSLYFISLNEIPFLVVVNKAGWNAANYDINYYV